MKWALILEYCAFGGALVSTYLYGHKPKYGPIIGITVSLLFIAWGLVTVTVAAILSNVVFFLLHAKNWNMVMKNDENKFVKDVTKAGNFLRDKAFEASSKAGWWKNKTTGEDLRNNPFTVPAKIALIHSEISEALEGDRKNKKDDHLPHRSSLEVELADAVIRIADLAGAYNLDLGGAIAEKMLYNSTRLDHKIENRKKADGKAY